MKWSVETKLLHISTFESDIVFEDLQVTIQGLNSYLLQRWVLQILIIELTHLFVHCVTTCGDVSECETSRSCCL